MKLKTKKAIALLLAFVQLFVLLPFGTVTAKAAEEPNSQTPELNRMIVGTVKVPSFNFLGDNEVGEDGIDYESTFYYTDDYFASSAINSDPTITDSIQTWEKLENTALATCSMDFAMASCSSTVGNVLTSSSRTWDNTDYSNKDSNVIQFLGDCGFENIEPHGHKDRPTNDSIGYTIARKTITVWNEATHKNETYTLIAVGCRGAGYAAEWASNVTIGDKTSKVMQDNGRHSGFDQSAQTVCKGVRDYLDDHNITGKVKYWVTGFSRAAAVANLVAGYLTDDPTTYLTSGRGEQGCPDVYGYTWECPQAASTDEIALNYKNIHNILNPMDAVPKVSPSKFEHQRLGVDYQMPYHGNTSSTGQNEQLYKLMYNVLKTIAIGNGEETDPLVDDPKKEGADDGYVSPKNYPYNSKMTIWRVSGWQLILDAIDGMDKLMSNFGTLKASGNLDNEDHLLGKSDGGWYIDDFIDNLIDVFLRSNAWEGGIGIDNTPLENRGIFIQDYQADLRTLLGYFIDYSGPSFLSLVPKVVAAIRPELTDINNIGLGYVFYRFYRDPTGSYTGWHIDSRIRNQKKKDSLIIFAKETAREVADNMTSEFDDPQNISRDDMHEALDHAVELLINLYAFELSAYESQYLGTTLKYLNTILCTHEQETVLSWIMSLDDMHMNRSCRTLTVPASADVTLYEFRDAYRQYDGVPTDDETTAPVVAEIRGGNLVAETLKDQRITLSESGDSIVIRYPASLKIRADVKANSSFDLSAVTVQDYQTKQAYTKVSDGKAQFADNLPAADYSNISADTTKTNAAPTNSDLHTYGTISKGDTLHILVDDIAAFDEKNVNTYSISLDKAPKSFVAEYTIKTVLANPVDELIDGTDENCFGIEQRNLLWNSEFEPTSSTYQYTGESRQFDEYDLSVLSQAKTARAANTMSSIDTRHTVTVVPAASIYYDDTLLSSGESVSVVSAAPDYQTVIESVEAALAEDGISSGTAVTLDGLVSFRFTGTRIDLYMNTTSNDSTVSAYVLDANGNRFKKDGIVTGRTISVQSDNNLFNVPTVSFANLPYDTYTLVVLAPKSGSYMLDGVRVYNEDRTTYTSVRETLIHADDWVGTSTVSGTVYLDFGKNGSAQKADYTAAGPKGEVYLKSGNGVAFEIDNYLSSATYRIGLGSADGNPVQVKINDGTPFTVSASTHMFYDLNLTSKNVVIQVTDGSGILSVTDIEETLPKLTAPRKLSLSVSPQLMRFAESLSVPDEPAETAEPTPEVTSEPTVEPTPEVTPEPTPEITPEPTPETTPEPSADPGSTFSQLISSFISSLFGSISRLFGH